MKFDKKVMESGVVAAFSLALAFSAVPVNAPAYSVLDSQIVELTAEPKEDSNEHVIKVKRKSNLVAAAITAEQSNDIQQEIKKAEKAEKSAKSRKDKEAAEPEQKEKAEKPEKENRKQEPEQRDKPEKEKSSEKPENEKKAKELEKEEKPAELEKSEKEEKAKEPEEGNKKEENQLVETASQEVSPWAEKLMPTVEEYLNVRTEASEEAELAGKLHKGASADILERGEEWTKIRSGSVEGYVKNEFCVTGLKAEALANELGTTYATAVTGGVRVRETPSAEEDVKILDVLEEEGKIKVNKEAEQTDGWVPVTVDDQTGYISAEYVTVELETGKAISIEEEQAMIAAAEAEKAAEQQASSQQSGAAASSDEVTLLGALIQCEAGGEPYEGQLAVGAVVMNRVRAGYAGSISGVIYQSGQFTPASSGALASVMANGVSGSCLQAAQEAISGASNIGGATSFRRAGSAQGIVIGNHVFF